MSAKTKYKFKLPTTLLGWLSLVAVVLGLLGLLGVGAFGEAIKGLVYDKYFSHLVYEDAKKAIKKMVPHEHLLEHDHE